MMLNAHERLQVAQGVRLGQAGKDGRQAWDKEARRMYGDD